MKQAKITLYGNAQLADDLANLQNKMGAKDMRQVTSMAFAVLDLIIDHELAGGHVLLEKDGLVNERMEVLKATKDRNSETE